MRNDTVVGLVSVMMPAFNAERFIARAIGSVLAQTLTQWELIVVDDGSTDRTGEIARACGDARVRVIRQENRGEAAARNVALASAGGAYLAFLDADDVFLPDHLQATVGHLEAHPTDIGVYADGYYVGEGEQRLATFASRRRAPFGGWLFESSLLGSDAFGPNVSVLLRLPIVRERGLWFDDRITIGPDWDFLTRCAAAGTFGYLDRQTCLYRLHGGNVTFRTSAAARRRDQAACRLKAVRMPEFAQCPVHVRTAVFYDLLVNGLRDSTSTQDDVTRWPEFKALPAEEQARLLRLTAIGAIADGGGGAAAAGWLTRAHRLNRADWRATVLLALATACPGFCGALLRFRDRQRAPRAAEALSDLAP